MYGLSDKYVYAIGFEIEFILSRLFIFDDRYYCCNKKIILYQRFTVCIFRIQLKCDTFI